MNSIAIIIILIISIVGVGSILWMHAYYNPKTHQINKTLLIASVTNIFNSNKENTDNEQVYDSKITSSLGRPTNTTEYNDVSTKSNNEETKHGKSITNFFTNGKDNELKSESQINKNEEKSKSIPIENYVPHSNTSKNETDTIITASAEERMKKEENQLNNTINTENTTNDEYKTPNTINTENTTNDEYKSPDTTLQEEIEKIKETEQQEPIFQPKENKEILKLYHENETITPSNDFEFKNTDQKRIENASNKIDKFYERLGEISLNKITKRNKEEKPPITETLKEETDIQSTFHTDNTLENDTIVTFNPEPQRPVSTKKEEVKEAPKSDLTLETKIDNHTVQIKRGDSIIFNHNNETYSSLILDVRPGEIYVNYRRQRIWISVDKIKKKFD